LNGCNRDSGAGSSGESSRFGRFRLTYWNRWTWLSVATFFYWVATQALRPFVPLHLADLGASGSVIGLAVAANPFLALFLAIPAGRLIDLRGLRRLMLGSLLGMAVVGTGFALVGAVGGIVALQAGAGLAELGIWVGMQAMVTQTEVGDFRTRHLALFAVAWGVGIALGPSVGAWLFELFGFGAIGLVYAACALAALAAVGLVPYRDAQRPRPGTGQSTSGTLKSVRVLSRKPGFLAVLIASFVVLWANSLRTSFYPIYLAQQGVSVPAIGLVMSVAGVAILVARMGLPWLANRLGARPILVAATGLAVVALSITPVVVGSTIALGIASAAFGVGFGLNNPLTLDLVAEHTESDERGLAMGMRVVANRAAQVLQPIAFGTVATTLTIAAGFGATGVFLILLTGWMATTLSRRSTTGNQRREHGRGR